MKKNFFSKFKLLLSILILSLASTIYSQTTYTWVGGTSSDWNDPNNWSSGLASLAVPTINDDVFIPDIFPPNVDPIISSAAVAKSVFLQADASLNISSGSLTVQSSASHGIENFGTITNNGIIIVNNTILHGIQNNGIITNNETINIDNTVRNGITISTDGTLDNNGDIVIGSVANSIGQHGLENFGIFNNNTVGNIEIDNVFGGGGFVNSKTLNNYGSIDIGMDISWVAIRNNGPDGKIMNFPCGNISLKKTLSNRPDAEIINDGLITFDAQGLIDNSGTFINNEIIISPTELSSICGNETFNPVFVIGFGASSVIGIYLDANAMMPAGTFDAHLNTFYPTAPGLMPGVYNFFVKIELGACTEIVPWELSIYSLAAATSITWTGNASTEWDYQFNWNPFIVPTICTDVIIPSAPANQPVINASIVGYAKSVLVEVGATLDLSPNSGLVINGSLGHGFENQGTVMNAGTLYIDKIDAIGFLNAENADFINMGGMNIGLLGPLADFGIYNRGLFQNVAGANVMIKNAMGGALNVLDNATNTDPNSQFDIQAGSTLSTEN